MKNNKPNRHQRIKVAQATLAIIKQRAYDTKDSGLVDLSNSIDACLKETCLFAPQDIEVLNPNLEGAFKTKFEVVNETTLEGAKRLHDQEVFTRIGVLNFASAKNAGGGFLGGSQAQEESLARSSALYESLQQCPAYYDYHRNKDKSLLYSNHMIYSPNCPVFRSDDGELLPIPYEVDFITSPAPNRGALSRNTPELMGQLANVFISRIDAMLTLAADQGCDALVLGAWGCGVFGNQPEEVAAWFASQLQGEGKFVNCFKHISFSIPENPRVATNSVCFQQLFSQ